MPVELAVIPAAGRGTRLLPATRSVPKELLPLGRTPVLDLVVAELASAGIRELVVVLAPGKEAIAEHLAGCGLGVTCVVQPRPIGLGDAVLRARAATAGEPFAVALPDALLPAGLLSELLARAADGVDGAVAVERVPPELAPRYGVAGVDAQGIVRSLVEKPPPGAVPGALALAGRYVLPPAVFDALEACGPGAGGEVQLTDAIAALVAGGARIAAVELRDGARRRDVGSPEGYCAAFLEQVLADPELAPAVERVIDARGDR